MKPILIFASFFILSTCLWAGCSKDDKTEEPTEKPILFPEFTTQYTYSQISATSSYSLKQNNLTSPDEFQPESTSGIVGGIVNTDLLFLCEGRKTSELISVFNKEAVFQAYIKLIDAPCQNWQDMAIGPGPEEGKSYIYIADIGDTDNNRESYEIIRFVEPDLSNISQHQTIEISDFDVISFSLPQSVDCESLMLDPQSKDLVVIAKMQAFVYRIPFPQSTIGNNKAYYQGLHRLRREIKAADIAHDRSKIIMKDVGEVFMWDLNENEDPVEVIFTKIPVKTAYVSEIEGGALGWTQDLEYFTITDTDKRGGDVRRGQSILYGYGK